MLDMVSNCRDPASRRFAAREGGRAAVVLNAVEHAAERSSELHRPKVSLKRRPYKRAGPNAAAGTGNDLRLVY